ncbi:hypothetical protein NIES4075_64180 [Tolypothrix sp. NIES-4075]|uniref:hypothetical protein n=1 Tax=Tolypothrix sp. NIES-4075 TaxID=2005459 RepID=UPI000B6C3C7F|nr:hypothetical protein [Tolypothrix sp. NIES-4075]GAX45397.1 hypothetical protein NIES4075_64180 [Tolypothrix sp. NIES-4075]
MQPIPPNAKALVIPNRIASISFCFNRHIVYLAVTLPDFKAADAWIKVKELFQQLQ